MGALNDTIDNWWHNLTHEQQLAIFTEHRHEYVAGDGYTPKHTEELEELRNRIVWVQDRFPRPMAWDEDRFKGKNNDE